MGKSIARAWRSRLSVKARLWSARRRLKGADQPRSSVKARLLLALALACFLAIWLPQSHDARLLVFSQVEVTLSGALYVAAIALGCCGFCILLKQEREGSARLAPGELRWETRARWAREVEALELEISAKPRLGARSASKRL